MEMVRQWDIELLIAIRQMYQHDFIDTLMIFVTKLGDAGFIWLLIGAYMYVFFLKRNVPTWENKGFFVLLSLCINAVLCNGILKPLFKRQRPYDVLGYDVLIEKLADFSFPSGHTSASFAAAMALFLCNKTMGKVAFLLASCIGYTRLYLGMHYPTDVFMGIFLGLFSTHTAMNLVSRQKRKLR